MALDTPARHIYTGNGNQRVFPIPTKIIGDDYIRIEIDGIYQSDRTKWDIVNNSIIFITAPLNGKVIDVQVATSEEALTNLGSVSNVDIVSASITNVNTVANNINEVVTVGTNIDVIINNEAGMANIATVAGSIGSVNTVATSIANVNSVASNATNINAVNSNSTNINTVATNNTNVTTVANNITKVVSVSNDIANIDTTVNNIGNIAIVASDLSNDYVYIEDNGSITSPVASTVGTSHITTVAEDITNINTVALNIANINSVNSNATNINSVVTNIVPNLTEILQADTNASNALTSANSAASSASSASTSATNASNSSILASKWASENKNVIVADGKYSAYHWAQIASDIVGSGIIDDTTPSTLKVYSSSKVTTSLPKVGFDTTNLVAPSAGQAAWNNTEATLDIGLNTNVTLQVGQEELAYVKNSTGSTIANGKVVMAVGTNGASGNILVGLHDGTKANAKRIVGISTEDIANGSVGYVTRDGKVRGIDTSGSLYGETWADGDIIYVKPNNSGGLTKVEPLDTQLKMPIAFVIKAHATNGTLYVRTTGIDENHDKEIIASKVPLTGDFSLDLGSIV